jgi:hypothetical protein
MPVRIPNCAARGSNFLPARSKKCNLGDQQKDRDYHPARLQPTQSIGHCANIYPTQRKIKQENGNCRLAQKKQHAAHRREVLNQIGDYLGLDGRLRMVYRMMQVELEGRMSGRFSNDVCVGEITAFEQQRFSSSRVDNHFGSPRSS